MYNSGHGDAGAYSQGGELDFAPYSSSLMKDIVDLTLINWVQMAFIISGMMPLDILANEVTNIYNVKSTSAL